MNILIIANDKEILDYWDETIGVEHHPLIGFLSNKTSQVDAIKQIVDRSRRSGAGQLYSCVGRLVGTGVYDFSTPEVMVELTNDLAMLPMNAYFAFSEIYLLPSKNTDYWRVLRSNGRTKDLFKYLIADDDSDVGPIEQVAKKISALVQKPISKMTAAYQLASKASVFRNANITSRSASTPQGMREALAELSTSMRQISIEEDEFFVCKRFNGWGWGPNGGRVQVLLNSERLGRLTDLKSAEWDYALRTTFGEYGVDMIAEIVTGIGGNYWREGDISFDLLGIRPMIYILHEGVTVIIEPCF